MILLLVALILAVLLFGAVAVKNAIAIVVAGVFLLLVIMIIATGSFASALMFAVAAAGLTGMAIFIARERRVSDSWRQLLRGEWGGGPVPRERRAELYAILKARGIAAAIEHHNAKPVSTAVVHPSKTLAPAPSDPSSRFRGYPVGIVGESHYQPAIARTHEGSPVRLLHEPDNRADPRAIRVLNAARAQIGYIPRGHWVTDAILDEGKTFRARVGSIAPAGSAGLLGVVIDVEAH